jgi:thiol-disulfide isomerase/thioredoxin
MVSTMQHYFKKLIVLLLISITQSANGEVNYLKNLILHDKPIVHREISFEDSVGKTINNIDLKGHITVIYFFASWCGDCIKELEEIDKLSKKFNSDKLLIFPLSEDFKQKDAVIASIQNGKKPGLSLYFDTKNNLMTYLNIRSIPTTIILNEDTDEVVRIVGRTKWNDQYILGLLTKYIDKIK